MPTTSNFGWTTPADTDLVKDGAAAIRTLGDGIDTSFLDLKGGTTDQVLAKNSNTDLDFKWVAQDDSNAIQNAIVDAKGDLISATAADTPARLAVGADGTVLTADSTEATGLKWAAPVSGGMTLLSTTNLTTTTTAITGISQDYTNLMIVVAGISIPTGQRLEIEFRSTTNARIVYAAGANQTGATTRNGVLTLDVWDANITATDTRNMCVAKIDNYADATRRKGFQLYGATNDGGAYVNLAGSVDNTAALNAFFVDCNAVPTAGTVQIWGIK